MAKYKYVRVSTQMQNPSRQTKGIFDKIYLDRCSGMIPFCERVEANLLLNKITSGDTLEVESIDRLGRDKNDINLTLEHFKSIQVNVFIKNLSIQSILDTGVYNPAFDIITSVLSVISEQERLNIKERTKQGIEIGKIQGKYKGRKKGSILNRTDFLERNKKSVQIISKHSDLSLRELAKLTNISYGKVRKIKALI